MNWFFSPAVRLFSGTRIAANLYWIGVLALFPLLILLALLFMDDASWMTPSLRSTLMKMAALCLGLEAYSLGALFLRIGPDVGKVANVIKRIGSGDLTARIDHAETFEGGELAQYVSQTNENLINIVAQVRASADAIVSGATEIAGGNHHLSQRTEAQAATLEETASSMEELAASAKQTADTCRRATDLSTRTGNVASASADRVSELIDSMGTIVSSSKQIEDIVSVIEGIAFQTNILALNAAVEAARAGEQGRGFAVVASEVRSLAQRSSTAAKEIKILIHDSVEHVNGGTRLVGKVAATIKEVVTSVREVNGLITDIAAAAREQSISVDEVNRGIAQLEQVSQQNAALVEEAGAVAMGFEAEASRLSEVVDKFKLDRMAARDQAVALVERAVQHLKAKGPERAYADFETSNSAFMFAEYYVYVLDFNAHVYVHPTLKGKNVMDLADSDGKTFFQPIIASARSFGKGWEDYRWLNPITQKIEQKSAYFQRVGDIVIACGIYKGDAQTQHSSMRLTDDSRRLKLTAPHTVTATY